VRLKTEIPKFDPWSSIMLNVKHKIKIAKIETGMLTGVKIKTAVIK